ncbi:MAG: MoxR family ATPase [Pseudomonadota bacterium]|nr:MoxR family ATPase [Pseudomonadota bacterium]
MDSRQQVARLQKRVSQSIIGQSHIVERLLIGILANGNLLVEGLPGLAKTRAVKSLAKNMEADFSRIQFTPDLLPSDITGTEVLHTQAGSPQFRFDPGPIFANIVLADEVNRAPAKVQAALLEAMEERQVTVAGKTHKMPDLFMVMATQNPVEQEGTYPLPEAQMDRFLMHVYIDYPDEEAEARIIRLVRDESGSQDPASVAPETIPQQAVFDARREIARVQVSEVMERYMVDLVFASRYPDRYDEDLKRWIQVGVSPRGGIALDKCARTHAWLDGRDRVLPDDVRSVLHDCFRHRLMLSYEAAADGVSASSVLDKLMGLVAVA